MPEKIGEVLDDLTKHWQDEFRKCIKKNKHRREPYYIFTKFEWRANYTQFHLTLTPMDFKPPYMLKTMLHKIDNKTGRIEEVWVLPVDAPVGPTVPLGPVDDGLINLAPHLPLHYN